MKTRYSILIICLLALFATGCKKENNGRIRIFAEHLKDDSKILIDPEDVNEATWLVGEYIAINGTPYKIKEDANGFYLDGVSATGNLLAIYPGSSSEGNDIVIDNNEVILKRLTIRVIDDDINENYGLEEVVFPMVATGNSSNDQLLFNHLAGGLIFDLVNNSYSEIELASLKIVAQSNSEVQHLGTNSVTVRWAVQGPALPHGEVGEVEDDFNAAYASEMNFDFTYTYRYYDNYLHEEVSNTMPVLNIGESSTYSICVPITISSLSSLTVTGYSTTGEQLFHVTKDLATTPATINRGTMYTIPDIIIGASDGGGYAEDEK